MRSPLLHLPVIHFSRDPLYPALSPLICDCRASRVVGDCPLSPPLSSTATVCHHALGERRRHVASESRATKKKRWEIIRDVETLVKDWPARDPLVSHSGKNSDISGSIEPRGSERPQQRLNFPETEMGNEAETRKGRYRVPEGLEVG